MAGSNNLTLFGVELHQSSSLPLMKLLQVLLELGVVISGFNVLCV